MPSSALTVRSSITFSFTGSLPEARLTARSLRALHREVAGDLRPAAEDRLVDVRRRQHLVVEDDRERLADILLRDPAEAARAGGVEGDVDVGPAVLVIALLGVGQLVARDHYPALDRDRSRRRRPSAALGCPAARGPAGLPAGWPSRSTSLNSSRAVWPISAFSCFGILDARDLDEDAIAAFGDDSDFLGSAADRSGGGPRRARRSSRPSAPGSSPLGVGVSTTRVESTTLTSQSRLPVSCTGWLSLRMPLDRRVDLGRVAHHERQLAAGRRDIADVDPRVAAKLGRNLVLLGLQPLLQRIALVGLEQQVAAAGKVEAEVDLGTAAARTASGRPAACRRSGWGSTAERRARRRARRARPSSAGIRASRPSRSPAWRSGSAPG